MEVKEQMFRILATYFWHYSISQCQSIHRIPRQLPHMKINLVLQTARTQVKGFQTIDLTQDLL